MPHFAYTARGAAGELLTGTLESADSSAAASQLSARGAVPVNITPTATPVTSAPGVWAGLFKPRITVIDLMMFSRQMHTLMKAGVPILRALAGLERSAANPTFAAVLNDVRESLDSGHELAAALARHPHVFTPFYINMVRIGEMTGGLEAIFMRMFQHLEFEKFMRDQMKSALRYPSFVIATMAAALVVINLFVIPAFAKVYTGMKAKLPLMTEVLIASSDFMVAAWPLLLIAGAGAFFGARAWVLTEAGRLTWDEWKLKLPIAGKIVLKATLARFARSLALSLRSGVPVVQALTTVAQTVDNDFIAERIDEMRATVERGGSIHRAANDAGVFTPLVLQMIAVGEESGTVDELMQEVAEMYQREVEYELKTLSAQIEPVLIICLAVLVLVLALGVFLPIWDLGRVMTK